MHLHIDLRDSLSLPSPPPAFCPSSFLSSRVRDFFVLSRCLFSRRLCECSPCPDVRANGILGPYWRLVIFSSLLGRIFILSVSGEDTQLFVWHGLTYKKETTIDLSIDRIWSLSLLDTSAASTGGGGGGGGSGGGGSGGGGGSSVGGGGGGLGGLVLAIGSDSGTLVLKVRM